MKLVVIACAGSFLAAAAMAQSSLPDPARTPGALNPSVTQETVAATICMRGWTRTVRPPPEVTRTLKRVQMRHWSCADRRLSHYEEDHLLSGVATSKDHETAVVDGVWTSAACR